MGAQSIGQRLGSDQGGSHVDDWARRCVTTFAIVFAAHVLRFVAMPWVDLALWSSHGAMGGWLLVEREPSPMSVAALGVVPLIDGLAIATFVFALVPKLNRSPEEASGEHRLLRAGLWVAVVLAVIQSVGIGLLVRNTSLKTGVDQDPWLVGTTLVLFGTLYALLPFGLERWGLGRGLSAAVLLYCLLKITAALHAIGFELLVERRLYLRNLALLVALIAATIGATRRWLGDTPLLPGDPRLDRIGRGLSIALLALVALNAFARQWLAHWSSVGEIGMQVLSMTIAVGGGLLLSHRQGAKSPDRVPGGQLLALGSFVLFAASTTAVLSSPDLPMPWSECVIATILIYVSWRHARQVAAPA